MKGTDVRMQDKVSVVTGAATAIGRAIAERLAGEGALVLCADVDGDGVAGAVAASRRRAGAPRRTSATSPTPTRSRR